jgi:hypothetical protein
MASICCSPPESVPPRCLALLQAREEREDLLEILVEILQVVEARAHLQVLEHGHAREDAAAFRRLRDAEAGDLDGSAGG